MAADDECWIYVPSRQEESNRQMSPRSSDGGSAAAEPAGCGDATSGGKEKKTQEAAGEEARSDRGGRSPRPVPAVPAACAAAEAEATGAAVAAAEEKASSSKSTNDIGAEENDSDGHGSHLYSYTDARTDEEAGVTSDGEEAARSDGGSYGSTQVSNYLDYILEGEDAAADTIAAAEGAVRALRIDDGPDAVGGRAVSRGDRGKAVVVEEPCDYYYVEGTDAEAFNGYGSGYQYGSGPGSTSGSGSRHGDEYGDGYGSGSGYGYGDAYGSASPYGYGYVSYGGGYGYYGDPYAPRYPSAYRPPPGYVHGGAMYPPAAPYMYYQYPAPAPASRRGLRPPVYGRTFRRNPRPPPRADEPSAARSAAAGATKIR